MKLLIFLKKKQESILRRNKMTKQQIISETVDILNKLPLEKAEEIRNLIFEYYEKKDEEIFEKGFEKLINESESYSFLNDDEDLYTIDDLIKRYK